MMALTAGAPSDEQLMAEVRDGSHAALEELFARYRQPVWGFFRRRVPDAAAAEDLLQNVFAALLEAAPRYRPSGAFRSYLFAIAFNVLQAERRKRAAHSSEPLDFEVASGARADMDRALWVQRALRQLDNDNREIVMLREYEGFSYDEIAGLLALPVNTVRSRLFRARMALRTLLTEGAAKEEQAG